MKKRKEVKSQIIEIKETAEEREFLKTMREQFDLANECCRKNKEKMISDLQFHDGDDNLQWEEGYVLERIRKRKPVLTMNDLPKYVDRMAGEFIMNELMTKVKPVDNFSDPIIADILEGHIRNIEYYSDANVSYNNSFKQQLICGLGAWRILTRYIDDYSFDQEIFIQKIGNQFSLYLDPMAYITGDVDRGEYLFSTDLIKKSEFERKYPNIVNPKDFEDEKVYNSIGHWNKGDYYVIAEYWYKVYTKKTLYKHKNINGQELITLNETEEDFTKIEEREVNFADIYHKKVCGNGIIEKEEKWPGKYFPFVVCWGKEFNIEDEHKIMGLIRNAKDPQRMSNYLYSKATEMIAMQPEATWLASKEMILGYEDSWETIETNPQKVMYYNANPLNPNIKPERIAPPQFPIGFVEMASVCGEKIKSAMNMYEASFGQRSNETSGKAIENRALESNITNYEFVGNFKRALRQSGRIILDLIRNLYDEKRIIRITGLDGSEMATVLNYPEEDEGIKVLIKEKKINPKKMKAIKGIINDISVGKYDVIIDSGPGYISRRDELIRQISNIIQTNPDLFFLFGDLYMKILNLGNTEEIVERVRKAIQQKYPELITSEDEGNEPEEPPPPNPMEEEQMKQLQLDTKSKELDINLKELDTKFKTVEILKLTKEIELLGKEPKGEIKSNQD